MLLNPGCMQHPVVRLPISFFLIVFFLSCLALPASLQAAEENSSETSDELKFPGEETSNKLVYHFNKSNESYQLAVLNTIRNMLRMHGDNIKIVVSVMGPGIHILLKEPGVPVIKPVRDQVESLAFYGVEFHACGNTIHDLGKDEKDIKDFATVVEAGVDDLMTLQQQGYAYISW
jgi:intracellular sulfur oxidation DsrE/DsrF family protein